MTGRLGAWAVPRQALLLSAVVTVVLVAAIVVAYLAGGTQGALALGMGIMASLRPALSLRPLHSLALAVPDSDGRRGGRGPAWAAARRGVLRRAVLPAGRTGRASCRTGCSAMVPTVVAVIVLVPGDFQPGRTAIWMLFGGALVVGVATRLPRVAPAAGVEQRRAWRHAAVMACRGRAPWSTSSASSTCPTATGWRSRSPWCCAPSTTRP